MLKTVSTVALAVFVAAPRLASQLPKECEGTPAHSLTYRALEPNAPKGSVTGRLVESGTGRPLAHALIYLTGDSLSRDSVRHTTTDSLGLFSFAHVASGPHRLDIRRLGFIGTSDKVAVSPSGVAIEATQQPMLDVEGCDFLRELAREPSLAVGRAETLHVERRLPNGARLRHTLFISGQEDEAKFVSVLKNVGSRPADIQLLCYPSAQSSALRYELTIGPACYSWGYTLKPGDSTVVETGGPLRGPPGRYHFKVHPIDPTVFDTEFDLRLEALKRKP